MLDAFWHEGIERNKDYESIVTIGMRGDGDKPMAEGGDMAANIACWKRSSPTSARSSANRINPDVTRVPQVWALYKEVQEYYEKGMRVPDDVTLLWCDDNWGNVRRLPTPEERKRAGGAGIYYHFDYVGDPRNYKWLNTNSDHQGLGADEPGHEARCADRIWMVNVGDI